MSIANSDERAQLLDRQAALFRQLASIQDRMSLGLGNGWDLSPVSEQDSRALKELAASLQTELEQVTESLNSLS